MHTLYKYILCIIHSRTCNRKITVAWVEGGGGTLLEDNRNNNDKYGCRKWCRVCGCSEWDGVEKRYTRRDCGARYDDAPTNRNGQWLNKNAKFRVVYGNRQDSLN